MNKYFRSKMLVSIFLFARDAAGKVTGVRWTGLTFELIWNKQ